MLRQLQAGQVLLASIGAFVMAFGGVGFILTLLLTATLMLAVKPKGRSSADLDKRDGFEA